MDLKQLEYIVAIGKYGNVSKAAEKLYITPSALNQQLSKLEKDLGQPLFIRNQRQLTPTQAGEIYLSTAQEMLRLKETTYARLSDLSDNQTGIFNIGLTYDHGNLIFNRIYPQFHRNFPGIELRCLQILVPDLHRMLLSHQLDMAFLLTGKPESYIDIEYDHLSTENLILGLSTSHPLARNMNPAKSPYCTISLSQIKDDAFALAPKHATMRTELIDPMFAKAGISPKIIMESSMNHFLEQICAEGIADCIIPQSMISNRKDIVWFYLPGTPRFDLGVAYPKGTYVTKAMKNFIDLSRQIAEAELDHPKPDTIY